MGRYLYWMTLCVYHDYSHISVCRQKTIAYFYGWGKVGLKYMFLNLQFEGFTSAWASCFTSPSSTPDQSPFSSSSSNTGIKAEPGCQFLLSAAAWKSKQTKNWICLHILNVISWIFSGFSSHPNNQRCGSPVLSWGGSTLSNWLCISKSRLLSFSLLKQAL